jgi:uncharacterized protein YegL
MTVLVTVVGPHGAADLELDDERPVGDLTDDVAAVLGYPAPVALSTEAGLELTGGSLAAAGVLDGHRLVLTPATGPGSGSRLAGGGPDGPSAGGGDATVFTCHLAVDTSDSMAGPALDAVNAELARLWTAVRADPRLAACRLGLVAFDTEARVVVAPTAASRLGRAPHLTATRPATNYEAAFRLVQRQVTRDQASLRSCGFEPLRPLVVLLTDGRPTRGYWPPPHAGLVDAGSADAVDLVAFGFGDAAETAIRRIGTAGAFLPAHTCEGRAAAPPGMLAAMMGYVHHALEVAAPGRVTPVGSPPPVPQGWRPL